LVVLLVTATGMASGSDSSESQKPNIEEAAHRLAAELLDASSSKHRPPLTSNAKHVRTIDPVLTEGSAVWIHESLPFPPLTVMAGRVFTYDDSFYHPLDAPVLKLRAIDDDQAIFFLVRVAISLDEDIPQDAAVSLSLPAPPIFRPRLGYVAAWVDGVQTPAAITNSPGDASISIRVPLARAHVEGPEGGETQIEVIIDGELHLGRYDPVPRRRFAGVEDSKLDPAIASLAQLELGRDFADNAERDELRRVVDDLELRSSPDYKVVVAVNGWVSSQLRYQEGPTSRTPVEVLRDESGDCDDYTALMVALLRTLGIPARRAAGLLYDLNTLSSHAWVEAALPTRDGSIRWFICDPTLAGTTPNEGQKAGYVQFKDRILFYPVRPTIGVEGFAGNVTTDVLLNWRTSKVRLSSDPQELNEFIDLVIERVDGEISHVAEDLAEKNLRLRRESASIPGSPYFFVDRPSVQQDTSRIQIRLENEERLVLDLMAEEYSTLESDTNLEMIDRMRTAFEELNNLFFAGIPAHHNLEFLYFRDLHTDRLHTISVRFGRYLVEYHLGRILKTLAKKMVLTDEEVARIAEVAEVSGGRNLYVVQELAREIPSSTDID
jgi:transglutaminase-like putative cysteine protease